MALESGLYPSGGIYPTPPGASTNGWTFAEIREEVRDRGYAYIAPPRIDKWIKQSYLWLCALQNWPFLYKTVEGDPPLFIQDLKQVSYVTQGDRRLEGADIRDLLDKDPALSTVGISTNWYLADNTVVVYPVSTDLITVRYIGDPSEYQDEDYPLVPPSYQEIIIDGAVVRGLKDNDEYDTANALQNVMEMAISGMTDALMNRDYQGNQNVVQTGYPGDYGA